MQYPLQIDPHAVEDNDITYIPTTLLWVMSLDKDTDEQMDDWIYAPGQTLTGAHWVTLVEK